MKRGASSGNFRSEGPRLVLVGGFLGAGKTTLIGQMARLLRESGHSCGIITNDQAAGLLDTATSRENEAAVAVAEVAGGCFCCKLDDFVASMASVEGQLRHDQTKVIIAEPVGSCTDLVATVLLPLEQTYGIRYQPAPFSVVVDGRRALASLGGARTPGTFSKDVGYIYRKQLEEAEVILANKSDVMSEEHISDLLSRLSKEYPDKKVFLMSGRNGTGVPEWLRYVMLISRKTESLMSVDYERYGNGEARLGWLNAEANLILSRPQDADEFLLSIANRISAFLQDDGAEVAHFKMGLMIKKPSDIGDLSEKGGLRSWHNDDQESRPTIAYALVNQVMSGHAPEVSRRAQRNFTEATLIVNLRAEADPNLLQDLAEKALDIHANETSATIDVKKIDSFTPGKPVPTARVVQL